MSAAGLFWTFVAGAAGWLVAEFIGKPVREFLALRRQLRVEILSLADVRNALWETGDSISDDKRRAQQESLRQLGVRALAFADTERLATSLLRTRRIRAAAAGRAAIRFADSLDKSDREHDAALKAVNRALQFPRQRRRSPHS